MTMEVTELFRIPFDFTFYLCVYPFHVVRDKKSNSFRTQTNRYQKIICAVLTFLSAFWVVREIRQSVPTNARNPSEHFLLLYNIFFLVQKWYIIKLFWKEQEAITDIFRFIWKAQNDQKLPRVVISGNWIKGITRGVGIVNIVMCAIMVASGTEVIAAGTDADTKPLSYHKIWKNGMLNATRYTLFLGINNDTKTDYSAVVDPFLIIIGTLGYLHRRLLGVYGDFTQTVTIVVLWILVKSFVQDTLRNGKIGEELEKKRWGQNWMKIDVQFNGLKDLADMINEKFGVQLLCLVASMCLYYSTSLDKTLIDVYNYPETINDSFLYTLNKIKTVGWLIFLLLNCVSILYFSAEISHQVGQ